MSHPPIQFPNANVPIVGAICEFLDVQPDVLILCKCDGLFKDRLIKFKMWGAVAKCRACGRHMTISVLGFDARTQNVTITVSPVIPRDQDLEQIPAEGSKPS